MPKMRSRLMKKLAKLNHRQLEGRDRVLEGPYNASLLARQYKLSLRNARSRANNRYFRKYIVPLARKQVAEEQRESEQKPPMPDEPIVLSLGPIKMRLLKDSSRFSTGSMVLSISDTNSTIVEDGVEVGTVGAAYGGHPFVRLGDRLWVIDKENIVDIAQAVDAMYLAGRTREVEHNPCSIGAIRQAIEGLPDDAPYFPDWAGDPPDDHEPGVRFCGVRRIEKDHNGDPGLSILVELAYLDEADDWDEDWDEDDTPDDPQLEYDNLEECKASGRHNAAFDNDGHCLYCGRPDK